MLNALSKSFTCSLILILILILIGGNRQEPAAARLLAHADTLQAAGLSVWTGGLADSNVALVHSASLTQGITYHTSTHTHLVSMQVGAQHRVCSAYWRPATSSAGASSQLAICDLDAACTDNTILLGDLNAEVITVDGKTTASRNDSRSRAVARWLAAHTLTHLHSHSTNLAQRHTADNDRPHYLRRRKQNGKCCMQVVAIQRSNPTSSCQSYGEHGPVCFYPTNQWLHPHAQSESSEALCAARAAAAADSLLYPSPQKTPSHEASGTYAPQGQHSLELELMNK